jgi:RHS repeat-associated protein
MSGVPDMGFIYDWRSTATTPTATCASGEVSRRPSYYRGEQYDSDLALYYLRARYYNPTTGRFLSRDPNAGALIAPASLHKYLYANGDPVDSIDPTGQGAIGEFIVNVWRNSITQTVVYAARLICWEVKWISWSIIGISHALGKPVTPFPWWMTWGCTAISGFGPPAIPSF